MRGNPLLIVLPLFWGALGWGATVHGDGWTVDQQVSRTTLHAGELFTVEWTVQVPPGASIHLEPPAAPAFVLIRRVTTEPLLHSDGRKRYTLRWLYEVPMAGTPSYPAVLINGFGRTQPIPFTVTSWLPSPLPEPQPLMERAPSCTGGWIGLLGVGLLVGVVVLTCRRRAIAPSPPSLSVRRQLSEAPVEAVFAILESTVRKELSRGLSPTPSTLGQLGQQSEALRAAVVQYERLRFGAAVPDEAAMESLRATFLTMLPEEV